MLAIKIDRLVISGRTLYRNMEVQLGVGLHRILHETGVSQDDRIHAIVSGLVDRLLPALPAMSLGISIERQKYFRASRVCIFAASKLSPVKLRALVSSRKPR